MMDNLRISRIKKALKAGFAINDAVYYEMIKEEPAYQQAIKQREIRHARRNKFEDIDRAFQEVPLTRA